ncbi:hypothetical protein [Aurantibacter aestuarii]|uniref:Lipoprotein n=1 Tax=Aurantibacter aestuarii TaxID=1266046 RepID=A0A2T1NE76_9FLAO|nr:hypothetical protein [Aurantibacter aestuarii]PSG90751.1 hypothetical protein C7H52_05610 [Aurantibacter aestuarii]
MTKNILLLLFLILLFSTSCKSYYLSNREVNKLELKQISNIKILNSVKDYRSHYKSKSVLFIFLGKNEDVYIRRIVNLSHVYNYLISYYSIIDEVPVIIFSKKEGYVAPKNYSSNFIKLLSNFLNDDMLMKEIKKDKASNQYLMIPNSQKDLINHSKIISYTSEKNEINYNSFYKKMVYENPNRGLFSYYRIIEGGIDERKP